MLSKNGKVNGCLTLRLLGLAHELMETLSSVLLLKRNVIKLLMDPSVHLYLHVAGLVVVVATVVVTTVVAILVSFDILQLRVLFCFYYYSSFFDKERRVSPFLPIIARTHLLLA